MKDPKADFRIDFNVFDDVDQSADLFKPKNQSEGELKSTIWNHISVNLNIRRWLNFQNY